MRTLAKNKQKMYYALSQTVEKKAYVLDREGNRNYLYTDAEGKDYYETEEVTILPSAVSFFGNIAMSGGEAEAVEFGLNVGDYEAVLLVGKNSLPIDETSLIWHKSEPQTEDKLYWFEDENAPTTIHTVTGKADYQVIKTSPSLNQDKYILKAVV